MIRLVRVVALTVAFLVAAPTAAMADYGSGTAGGPVGTPVLSTAPYTAVSDVLIVGDSITVRGYKDLAAALPGKRLAVNAHSGRNTKASIDSLFHWLANGYKLPPVLVMAVGTNDIFDPSGVPAQVKRLLAGVPSSTKVFWIDVQAARPKTALADQRNSGWVNQAIWRGCVGGCTVISWAGFLAAKPARIGWYIDSGGVHTDEDGKKAWAALIAGAVKASL
jgi:hypothetical protein